MSFYKKYKNVIKVVLLLIVLAFVGQFIWQTDFEEIGGYLKKMPYTFIGILMLSFVAYFSATLSWKLCMGKDRSKQKLTMRKFTFIALLGACLAVPGSLSASSNSQPYHVAIAQCSSEISPQLIAQILKYVGFEYGYDYLCLCEEYAKGNIQIDKSPLGYQVTIQEDGGGLTVIEILEDL